MNKISNDLSAHTGRESIGSAVYHRMKSLLIPLVCVSVMSIALAAQSNDDTRDGSAVFSFATPCNEDAGVECLHFQWPTMFGGVARVAIPFFSRHVDKDQNQNFMHADREVVRLSNHVIACIEDMGGICI